MVSLCFFKVFDALTRGSVNYLIKSLIASIRRSEVLSHLVDFFAAVPFVGIDGLFSISGEG